MARIMGLVWALIFLVASPMAADDNLLFEVPNPVAAEGNPRAVIFHDSDVSNWERATQQARITYEITRYIALGYSVEFREATPEAIINTIVEGEADRISFFGHGYGHDNPDATSTMLFIKASTWKSQVIAALSKKYRNEGLSARDARTRATAESQNFGFVEVRNHSCSSLIDTTLAEQFVRPGGTYSGVGASYVACPTHKALYSDVSLILDDYIVPYPTPAIIPHDPRVLCERLGPADGCLPGSANCLPCPGNSNAWYDATRFQVPPAE